MSRSRWGVAAAVLAVIAGTLGVSLPAGASSTAGNANDDLAAVAPNPHAVDCIKTNEAGQEYWYGEASPAVLDAADVLSRFVWENPEIATGVMYCSDRSGLLLFVSELTPLVSDTVHRVLGGLDPETETLDVVLAAAPLASLQKVVDGLPAELLDAAGVVSLGVSVMLGEVTITVTSSSAIESEPMARLLAEVTSISPGVSATVRVDADSPPVTFSTDRRDDVAP